MTESAPASSNAAGLAEKTRTHEGAGQCGGLPLTTRRSLRVTAEEFERLNEEEAELWIAERYSRFVESGLARDLSLIFAVHPNVEVPRTSRNV
jgi:hypothetical protein